MGITFKNNTTNYYNFQRKHREGGEEERTSQLWCHAITSVLREPWDPVPAFSSPLINAHCWYVDWKPGILPLPWMQWGHWWTVETGSSCLPCLWSLEPSITHIQQKSRKMSTDDLVYLSREYPKHRTVGLTFIFPSPLWERGPEPSPLISRFS